MEGLQSNAIQSRSSGGSSGRGYKATRYNRAAAGGAFISGTTTEVPRKDSAKHMQEYNKKIQNNN